MVRRYIVRDPPYEYVVPNIPVRLLKDNPVEAVSRQWQIQCYSCGGTSSLFSAVHPGPYSFSRQTFVLGYCLPHSFTIKDRLYGWDELVEVAVVRSVVGS